MQLEDLYADWSTLWLPPRKLPLSQWAEKHFRLSQSYSATNGKLTLFGWQREIFDAWSDPRVSEVVLKVGTQLVKTLLIQVIAAYVMAEEPGPMLVTQPDDKAAYAFSRERLTPMIRDMEILSGRVSEVKSRDGSNTTLYKEFPGGTLSIVGAVAPGNAARRSIQFLLCDEINKYPASSGKEGSFIKLADERTSTYRSRAKRLYACSPTDPRGAISVKYEATDQRKPWVPCPQCGHFQILRWLQVRWDETVADEDKASTAYYQCENCPAQWNDFDRWRSAEAAVWRPSKPFRGAVGFWISHLYSPHKTLSQIVQTFLLAQASGSVHDLQPFINTNLAEEWVEKGEAPEYEKLLDRREEYLGDVPAGVLLVTAGVDIHPDRLEVEVVGWGRRRESWSLDYLILDGRPSEPEVWEKLELLLGEVFVSESGMEMPISRMFVDSGHATNEVYAWVRRQSSARVVAIKGEHRGLLPVGPPSPVDVTIGGKKIKAGLRIRTVQVSYFKSEFYADLGKRRPSDEEISAGAKFPPGYCHFPRDGNYGDEHFKQICAEQLVTTRDRVGRERREWQQIRARNEALDCRVYARAAVWDLGMDRFKEHHWIELEQRRAAPPAVEPQEDPAPAPDPATMAPVPEQNQDNLFPAPRETQMPALTVSAAGTAPRTRPPAPIPPPRQAAGWIDRRRNWLLG